MLRGLIRKVPPILWVVVPLALGVYLYRLDAAGLIGPDEPRYASIAREMSRSGDWVTPRLWGEAWFEKPALLYWVAGAGFRLGLGPELAPRLPIAVLGLAFLGFYWWILKREFGCHAATLASLILGTTAAWIGYSQVAVPDLLLSTTFSAAILLALPWIARGDAALLPMASAMLGLAVLAKGPLPVVLAAPVLLRFQNLRELIRPRVTIPFLAIAAPWYMLCYLENGRVFFDEFIIKHNVQRAVSTTLIGHVRPWWYYLPVFAALLLPWTPLVALLFRRGAYHEPRRRFLMTVAALGFVILSLVVNKLPGYVLPLAPAVAALLGVALAEADQAHRWLLACGILLVAFPIFPTIAAGAVAGGLAQIEWPAFHWTWLLPAIPALAAYRLDAGGRRIAAVLSIAAGASVGVIYLKWQAAADLDRLASARILWMEIQPHASTVCIDNIGRAWRYGLNYYSVTPLPECSVEERPIRVLQIPGQVPHLAPTAAGKAQPG